MSRYKTEVEECRILDINILKGACKKGFDSGEYRWWYMDKLDGKIGYSISMDSEEYGTLKLSYKIRNHSQEEYKDFDCPIEIVSSKCNYGGYRYWMICPLIKGGIPCRNRVLKLYLSPGSNYFGCRDCLEITYASKSKNYHNPLLRAMTNLFKYSELADQTKRLYYNGKPTRKALKLARMGYFIKDSNSDINNI